MPDTRLSAKTRQQNANVPRSQSSPPRPIRDRTTCRDVDGRNVIGAFGSAKMVGKESTERDPALADTAEFVAETTEEEARSLKVRVHNLKVLRVS